MGYSLADTVDMMLSNDYKERFKGEYYQLKYRHDKLHDMVVKYEAGTLNFKPNCPLDVLKAQRAAMRAYMDWLEVRAEIEGIELE